MSNWAWDGEAETDARRLAGKGRPWPEEVVRLAKNGARACGGVPGNGGLVKNGGRACGGKLTRNSGTVSSEKACQGFA